VCKHTASEFAVIPYKNAYRRPFHPHIVFVRMKINVDDVAVDSGVIDMPSPSCAEVGLDSSILWPLSSVRR